MSDDFPWEDWIGRSSALAKFTPAALRSSLIGFSLQPKQGMDWLARALQGALCFHFPFLPEESPITGECVVIKIPNATEAKRSYGELSKAAEALFAAVIRNSELLAHRLTTPKEYAEICSQVERIAALFADAANDAVACKQRWRGKRAREDRIQMATAVAPIFELAFDRKPAVNNRSDDGGPWPDFCRRVSSIASPEQQSAGYWRDIAKSARQMDLLRRGPFAPGQIPE